MSATMHITSAIVLFAMLTGCIQPPGSFVVSRSQSPTQIADPEGVTPEESVEIEIYLNQLGYLKTKPDGIVTAETNAAIGAYQSENALLVDGEPSQEILELLRSQLGG